MSPEPTTRERLILAAERLFAEYGIDAVSLRQVNAAAGQRNASASHYHFGSKEALIEAILEHRMPAINQRRLELLEELEATDRAAEPRALVEAIVRPLAEHLDDGAGHYVRFLAAVTGHHNSRVSAVVAGRHGAGVLGAAARLRAVLVDLPAPVFAQRFQLAVAQTIYALADRERLAHAASNTVPRVSQPFFVQNLVDAVTGALCAPLSPAAARELEGHGSPPA